MKKLLFVAACLLACGAAMAQGTINFNNRVLSAGIDAPIHGTDGTTPLDNTFSVQLYAGPNDSSLNPIGSAIAIKSVGYFSGGALSIPTVAGGATASVQVRAWMTSNGASFEAASANPANPVGKSGILHIALGDPGASPPTLPANMVGLTSFSLGVSSVPEPSTMALAALGAAALLLRRRK